MKVLLLIAFVGLVLSAGDRRSAVEQSFSFGSIFSGVKNAVNTVKNGVTHAANQVKSGVNTAVQHTTNGVNTAIQQTQKGINIALGKTKEAIVDQAINNGLKVGVMWTKDAVLKAYDESKNAFVTVGKLTEQTSKNFANDVKRIALLTGKTLDPRQIKPEHLIAVLNGVRLVTGPLQVVLTNPAVEMAMSRMGPKVQIAYKLLTFSVKCINDPEHVQQHLMEANPIAGLLTQFVVNTIKNPDNWQDNLIEIAPGMGEALIEIAKTQAAKKLMLGEEKKPPLLRRLMKHFSH